MVIFLEKYLVTITGYAAFTILIPVACVLLIAGLCANKNFLKVLATKIAVFGLVIYLIIPFSMNVSSVIEQTYDSTVEATMKEAEDLTDEINENSDSEGNILDQAISKIKGGISGLLEKGEELLNRFYRSHCCHDGNLLPDTDSCAAICVLDHSYVVWNTDQCAQGPAETDFL
mgnify:CR=1 FL=1